eukprot:TRINITY_DN3968_c0_g2_i1.p1 TRINITY_DN3968_c0_g2~~TRINITY_DN3968_c0_g2_i1.p1  ORF type:complete len:395 (-),score=16.91 TRINITY_DN3968_c0_g2_i1:95-1231(-)
MDSDTIVIPENGNLDELFDCGHFCVVYQNPCNFHTGLLVIKPDNEQYNQMLLALEKHSVRSYDGADQGFLTAYFSFDKTWASPMFDYLRGSEQSDTPIMRLAPGYNLNAFWFYEKGDYELYRCHHRFKDLMIPGLTLTFPVPTKLKPWFWIPYLWLDVNYDTWLAVRMTMPDQNYSTVTFLHFLLSGLAVVGMLYTMWKYPPIYDKIVRGWTKACLFMISTTNYNVVGVLFGLLSVVAAIFVPYFVLIPHTFPPANAFSVGFFYFHAILFFSALFTNQIISMMLYNSGTIQKSTLEARRSENKRQFQGQIFSVLKRMIPGVACIIIFAAVCYFRYYPVYSYHLGKIIWGGYILTTCAIWYLFLFRSIVVKLNTATTRH